MLNQSSLEGALDALGRVLAARGLRYELVAAGGSGLMLIGLLVRPTRDIDIVALVDAEGYHRADPLPEPLVEAVRDVGETLGLGPDWLNAGPAGLLDLGLPEGFAQRLEMRTFGALILHLASRYDQICFKLYAAADNGTTSKHFQDLVGLSPQRGELLAAARWSCTHDPSSGYRTLLLTVLAALGVDDADAHL